MLNIYKSALVLVLFVLYSIQSAKTDQTIREFRNSKLSFSNDNCEVSMKITDAEESGVNFFVIGDWGGMPVYPYRTLIEQTTASEMTRQAGLFNTSFQLALGDNFYETGVQNKDDKRFKETYEDVFNTEHLMNTPWFMLLGNHDHYGNPTAQLEYTNSSKRWILPAFNYSINVSTASSNTQNLIQILMLDTVIMCGNSGSDWELDKAPRFRTTRERLAARQYTKQVERRLAELAATQPTYLLVAGHFPVWSIAEHGPTKCLVDNLRPLLHKYNVSAYLSGHDHGLQHISDTFLSTRVEYIVSGASNFVDTSKQHINDVPAGSLKFHWSDQKSLVYGGFAVFRATPQNMSITFVETNGTELYHTVILPRAL